MQIRFLRQFNNLKPGYVVGSDIVGEGAAQLLIKRGVAEEVKAEKPKKAKKD